MAKLDFNSNGVPTVGVEIELGIVDADSQQLTSGSNALLKRVAGGQQCDVKHELMQCCIEVISGVCHTIPEARSDLATKLKKLEQAADAESMSTFATTTMIRRTAAAS